MIFNLKDNQAQEIAAIADACSNKNDGRVTLESVCVEVDQDAAPDGDTVLRVVATDSYTLAKREVVLSGEVIHDDRDDEFVVEADKRNPKASPHLMFDGKAFKKAIKDTLSHKGIGGIIMQLTPDEMVVTHKTANAPEITLPTARNSGTFPKWRSLYGAGFERIDGELPAFDPVKLANMAKFVSVKPSDRSTYPFRMKATSSGEKSELKPWLFTMSHTKPTRSDLEVLLMPVRV